MELTQRPDLKQKVTLSPQVYQGLNILAMPLAELELLVEAEMLENPVLELDEPADEPESEEERSESQEERARLGRVARLLRRARCLGVPRPPRPQRRGHEHRGVRRRCRDLRRLPDDQVGLLDVSEDLEHAARAVIGSLDSDGFFRGTAEEMAQVAGVDLAVAEQAIALVQQLDPPGSLREILPRPS